MGPALQVLLVEDSPSDAFLAREALASSSVSVTWVQRLSEARVRLEAATFDVVLLDLGLPDSQGLGGFETLHRDFPRVPVVVLTGQDDADLGLEAVHAGAQDFLSKSSCSAGELSRAVHYAVERGRLERELRESEDRLSRLVEIQDAVLNSMPAQVALLDAGGRILIVNEAWRHAGPTGGAGTPKSEGVNYLEVCDRAVGPGSEDAQAVAAGIRDVLSGARAEFTLEYACPGPREVRWYRLMATAVLEQGRRNGAVVMHIDIAWQKRAEVERQRLVYDLNERIKEMRGLQETFLVLRDQTLTMGEVVQAVADILPMAMQFPERCAARVSFADTWGSTQGYEAGKWQLASRFTTSDGAVGWVEVVYCGPEWTGTEDPFLPEERRLVEQVGEMIRTEIERRYAERRFRSLLDSVAEGVHGVDTEGRIVFQNAAALSALGYGGKATLGEPVHALLHHHRADGTPYPKSECPLHRTLLDGQTRRVLDEVYFRKDGSSFPVEYTAAAVRDESGAVSGAVVTFLDVTEQRAAEDLLRVSEERFRLLAEATTDVIRDWEVRDDQVWYSDGLRERFGYAPEELLSGIASWAAHVHDEDRARVMESLRLAIEDVRAETWKAEYRFRCRDGRCAYVMDRGHLIRDRSGLVVRMVGGITDLTERKNLENQLMQSQKMEAIGSLAGGVAHDFNNLLTIINGNVHLLLTHDFAIDDAKLMLSDIRDAGDRASGLTRQLLAFSRKQVLRPQVIDLNEAVGGVEKMLRRLIGENIELVAKLDSTIDHIRVDPGQFEQVLVNLCVNARDAMQDGGVLTIRTSRARFHADSTRQYDGVALEVADTGCGIPPEIIPRIFEPFFTTKTSSQGTGLGLSTVFGIVSQSGARIDVDSTAGRGTMFRIVFPAVASAGPKLQKPEAPLPRGGERILVVEDEEGVRSIIARTLQSLGYQTLIANNGDEAIEIFERQADNVAMILTDVVMPGLGGRALVRRLRMTRPELRAVYMSGYIDDAVLRLGIDGSTDTLLHKPFSATMLATRIREVLDAT